MGQELDQLIARQYPRIAEELLSPLLELVQLARAHCGGDSDKFLIMLVVAVRTAQDRDFTSRTPEQLSSGEFAVFPGLGTNARSIAESLGIPKETVRRKVCELVRTGWLVRRDGLLFATTAAYQELAPVREGIQRLAKANHRTIALLEAAAVQAA